MATWNASSGHTGREDSSRLVACGQGRFWWTTFTAVIVGVAVFADGIIETGVTSLRYFFWKGDASERTRSHQVGL